MILVGNQRGGARDLAQHLMKPNNERVEVAELRGFVADNLEEAFQESYAISRGTKCRQFLYSLSLNPPMGAVVSEEEFRRAIDQAETKLGLSGQPRAVVFHEKRGDDGELRRHAHAVWSRIDVQEMKAVHLPHTKVKLQEVARDLYLEHGWTMPQGLAVTGARDPRNFTLAEWQQAKRIGEDPREIKAAFQDAWAISDSKAAFANALQERGYWLARGDKRGYVAVDHHGEVHNIAKRVGVKTNAVRERLGDMEALPSVADAKREIARDMQATMEEFQREVASKEAREKEEAARQRGALRVKQEAERKAFEEAARLRQESEERERKSRLRTGLAGLWDRLRGERKRALQNNAREAAMTKVRDQVERDRLRHAQAFEAREAIATRTRQRSQSAAVRRELAQDAQVFRQMELSAEAEAAFRPEPSRQDRLRPERERPRRRRGPSMER
ncbi:MAG: cell envelope integrity protein TolA [Alphaproteobacteria bacterium]